MSISFLPPRTSSGGGPPTQLAYESGSMIAFNNYIGAHIPLIRGG